MSDQKRTPKEQAALCRIQLDVLRQAVEMTIRVVDDTIIAMETLEGTNDNRPKR